MLIEPVEARTELCAAATDWIEVKHLAGRVGINLLNLGVEVENVHSVGPLAFQDGTDFRLKEPQLPRIDRTRAIDGDCDFASAFAHNAGDRHRATAG